MNRPRKLLPLLLLPLTACASSSVSFPLKTFPTGADIFVNGLHVGTSGETGRLVTLDFSKSERCYLQVAKRGYIAKLQKLTMEEALRDEENGGTTISLERN